MNAPGPSPGPGDRLRTALRAGSFSRNVLTLLGGNGAAQILFVLCSPVLARLYAPRQLGVLALCYSVSAILDAVVCLSYPVAILQADNDGEARQLARVSFGINAAVSGLLLAVAVALRGRLAAFPVLAPLDPVMWMIPLLLFAMGAVKILNHWITRNRRFGAQATARFGGALSTVSLFLGLGWIAPSASGLVAGALVGQAVVFALQWGGTVRHRIRLFAVPRTAPSAVEVLRKYADFPRYTMPGTLFNKAVADFPTLILTSFFGATTAGWFFLARRILVSPVSLAGEALSQVFHQRIAERRTRGEAGHPLILRLVPTLLLGAAIPLALLAAVAPAAFAIVFGGEWRVAGEFVRVLVPMYLMKFAVSPVTRTFLAYGKQRQGLIWQLAFAATTLAALWLGAARGGAADSLLLYSVTGAVLYLVILLLCYRWSGGQLGRLGQDLRSLLRGRSPSSGRPG